MVVLFLFVLGAGLLVALLAIILGTTAKNSGDSPSFDKTGQHEARESTAGSGERVSAPPLSGDLDKLRVAYQEMATEDLKNILEMGASLKPGAEDLLLQELDRRQETEGGAA